MAKLATFFFLAEFLKELFFTSRTKDPIIPRHTVVDDVLDIILKEGFAGAIIIILFAWTFRVDKANRAEQKENIAKFEDWLLSGDMGLAD